jgi:hypothetical protein
MKMIIVMLMYEGYVYADDMSVVKIMMLMMLMTSVEYDRD